MIIVGWTWRGWVQCKGGVGGTCPIWFMSRNVVTTSRPLAFQQNVDHSVADGNSIYALVCLGMDIKMGRGLLE